jgi:hypothetical protein
VTAAFNRYRAWRGEKTMVLYRTTKPDRSNPWLWYELLTHPRWNLPYLEPSPKNTEGYWKTIFANRQAAFDHSRRKG